MAEKKLKTLNVISKIIFIISSLCATGSLVFLIISFITGKSGELLGMLLFITVLIILAHYGSTIVDKMLLTQLKQTTEHIIEKCKKVVSQAEKEAQHYKEKYEEQKVFAEEIQLSNDRLRKKLQQYEDNQQ